MLATPFVFFSLFEQASLLVPSVKDLSRLLLFATFLLGGN